MNCLRSLERWDRGFIPLKAWLSVLVCVYSVFVLLCMCVEVLRRADPPSKESYRLCIGSSNWKSCQGPTKGCRAIIILIIIYLSMALQPLWTLAGFFIFSIYTQPVGPLGLAISPSKGRYLHTEKHKHRINAG
jgi:hypothetical protein